MSTLMYRLEELQGATGCVVAQSEKDLDALRALGVYATCSTNGWTDVHRDEVVARGITTVVIPAGHTHAKAITRSALDAGVEVRIINLPLDSAWVEAGATFEEVQKAVSAASPITP